MYEVGTYLKDREGGLILVVKRLEKILLGRALDKNWKSAGLGKVCWIDVSSLERYYYPICRRAAWRELKKR